MGNIVRRCHEAARSVFGVCVRQAPHLETKGLAIEVSRHVDRDAQRDLVACHVDSAREELEVVDKVGLEPYLGAVALRG